MSYNSLLADSSIQFLASLSEASDQTTSSTFVDLTGKTTITHTPNTGGTIKIVDGKKSYDVFDVTSSSTPAYMTLSGLNNIANATFTAWVYQYGSAQDDTGILVSRIMPSYAAATGIIIWGTNVRAIWNGNGYKLGTSLNLTLNTWTHIAVTRDSSNMRFYKDGSLVQQIALGAGGQDSYGSSTPSSIPNFYIGSDWYDTYNRRFPGAMRNVGFFTRTLTSTEINTIYSAQSGAGGPVVTVPDAPTITDISGGNTQLQVSFTAPANDGGGAITNYEYSTNDGVSWTTPNPVVTTSPLTITGLSNGTSYQVKLRAVNSAGSGTPSTASSGTPRSVSGTIVSAATNLTVNNISTVTTNVLTDLSGVSTGTATQKVNEIFSLVSQSAASSVIKAATLLSINQNLPTSLNSVKSTINDNLISLGVTRNIPFSLGNASETIFADMPSQFKQSYIDFANYYVTLPSISNTLRIDLDKRIVLSLVPGTTYTVDAISNGETSTNSYTFVYNRGNTVSTRYINVTPTAGGTTTQVKVSESITFNFATAGSKIFFITTLGSPGGTGEYSQSNVPCLCGGTRVLTKEGYKAVECLVEGEDEIVTSEGRVVEFKVYKTKVNKTTKSSAPYRIGKDAYGVNRPSGEIRVSPLHAVQMRKGVWDIPYFTTNSKVVQEEAGHQMEYYHVELPNFYRDNLVCEGLTTESYGRNQVSKGEKVYKYSKSLGGFTRGTLSLTASRSP